MIRHIRVAQIGDSGEDLEGPGGAGARDGTRDEAGGAEATETEVSEGGAGRLSEAGEGGSGGDGAGVGAGVGEGAAGGNVEELAAGDFDVYRVGLIQLREGWRWTRLT